MEISNFVVISISKKKFSIVKEIQISFLYPGKTKKAKIFKIYLFISDENRPEKNIFTLRKNCLKTVTVTLQQIRGTTLTIERFDLTFEFH